jgi:predicted enzyme related to lactoylglutathione lyase
MATIVHFDIAADEPERARAFYEKLFGWTFTRMPPPMDTYQLIGTRDLDGASGIGGGMTKRDVPGQGGITNYHGVASIEASLQQVAALGGRAVTGRLTVPGFGHMAVCLDTEGNPFGLFQEDPSAQ